MDTEQVERTTMFVQLAGVGVVILHALAVLLAMGFRERWCSRAAAWLFIGSLALMVMLRVASVSLAEDGDPLVHVMLPVTISTLLVGALVAEWFTSRTSATQRCPYCGREGEHG